VTTAPTILSLIGFVGFLAGLVVLVSIPASSGRLYNRQTKTLIIAAYAVYVYVLGIDMVETTFRGTLLGELRSLAQILFPIFLLMALMSGHAAQQMLDLRRSQTALRRSNEFMLDLVDSSPAGMLFLAPHGLIVFANKTAREILDLSENPDTGLLETAGWVSTCSCGARCERLECLLDPHGPGPYQMKIEWPTGWTIHLEVHTEPLADEAGNVGGVVATFERPAPHMVAGGPEAV